MELHELKANLASKITQGVLIHATMSNPRQKSNDLRRIKVKPILLRDTVMMQVEFQFERVMKHENILVEDFIGRLDDWFTEFRQFLFRFEEEEWQFQLSKKMKVAIKTSQKEPMKALLSHDRKKTYLLEDGVPVPFLIRLGVMTEAGQVKKQKYDKFKQINRFLEFVEDSIAALPTGKKLRILDFGCGKSYLTFALYHYLKVVKGFDLEVTGLDLKKEVIEECTQIARDLDYTDLTFRVGDVHDYTGETEVDLMVTLHACDVATDVALARAVDWNASVILSVPCCQKELNRQLDCAPLDVMLQHGLIKEKFASLATDSIRAELLTLVGYEAQLLEFIDLEHTPKNILIRAYKQNKRPTEEKIDRYIAFRDLLQARPFLENELSGRLGQISPKLVQ
ncbi:MULTISPECIES: SAM-dependent methyltransferase [Exiguobacterium]|uniref:class I SAM-dependent methyltransferase n=1 Tax=Exiguobacterium TaxID=33986 RepID=UPI00044CF3B3|nr:MULTISPECIES: SAM-dependent methyltransferase [Exiguobacterium]EZP61836.1 SAM-dependent methyltransferase [Exiguobacterium sp. RIT341]MDQ6466124.1 SAM-dependent methyltransferase [Exiguobacterium acetylicum]HAK99424.1 SAM-dependent methyltransferase [Exiguobacterium sp.]HCV54290.1 SAM-dependent methyltransferase [Exiguobacterium sp.]